MSESIRYAVFIILLSMTISQQVHAKSIDSMLMVLETDISSRERILTHNRIAYYYSTADTTQFLYHKGTLDSLAIVHNDTLGQFLAHSLNIMYYTRLEKLDVVEYHIHESLRIASGMKDPKFRTGTLYELALLKKQLYQRDSAVYYAEMVYELDRQDEDLHPVNLIKTMIFLAQLHNDNLEYKKALDIYFKADEIADGMTDRNKASSKAEVYNAIASTYSAIGDTALSIDYLMKSASLYKLKDNAAYLTQVYKKLSKIYAKTDSDSSFYYLNEAYASANNVGRKSTLASIANQMGDHWFDQGDLNKASSYYDEALSIFTSNNRVQSLADTKMRIGRLSQEQGKYKAALRLYNESLEVYNDLDKIDSKFAALKSKSEVLSLLGRHKESRITLEEAFDLNNEIKQKTYDKEVKDVQTKYETEKKELEIKEQQMMIAQQKKEQRTIIGGALLLLSFALLAIWSIVQRSRKNKLLSLQKEELQNQKIKQLEKEKTILSMSSMIEGQEAERKRIAQDLHDGLGGLLATVKAKFGVIQNQIKELESINVYQEANHMLDNACTEVRKIAHNMMPDSLTKLGLVEAVRDIAGQHAEMQVKVIDLGLNAMDETKQVMLYRVVQEFLNNTRKHAKASEVIIQFSSDELNNIICLEDDGQGYDTAAMEKSSKGVGLKSMQSRVDFIKGELDVVSEIGVGTTMTITVPK